MTSTPKLLAQVVRDLVEFLNVAQNRGLTYVPKEIYDLVCELEMTCANKEQVHETSKGLSKVETLGQLKSQVSKCCNCRLCKDRNKPVFGQGPVFADLMVVGEAPGREEDLTGKPFVGKAGELLTKMLRAINIDRKDVFITSVVKCRPKRNRTPRRDEIEACLPFLKKQMELIDPKFILCLGHVAADGVLGTRAPVSELRGHIITKDHRKVVVTYHPAYLLRFSNNKKRLIPLKREAWHDLQLLQHELEKAQEQRRNSDKA